MLEDRKQLAERIKGMRSSLEWSQKDLAKKASVSQSTIAKVEQGSLETSYSVMARIYNALENETAKRNMKKTVKDICAKDVRYVEKWEALKKAQSIMKNNGFSQLPVLENGLSIGTISERILMERLLNGEPPERLRERKVQEVMGNPLPQVSKETPVDAVRALLISRDAVLVVEKEGKVCGILTKSDLY